MKKTKIIALAAAFSLTLTALPLLVYGDEAVYNSEEDPLVSLSYINEVIIPEYDKKIEALETKISGMTEIMTLLQNNLTTANNTIEVLEEKITELSENDDSLGQYKVEHLKKGTKLLAESPCEIILRSGSAIVVSITTNGLNDISNGEELLNAANVPLFHCLLVPRGGDGRGIQITSSEAYVMVRGDYKIVE